MEETTGSIRDSKSKLENFSMITGILMFAASMSAAGVIFTHLGRTFPDTELTHNLWGYLASGIITFYLVKAASFVVSGIFALVDTIVLEISQKRGASEKFAFFYVLGRLIICLVLAGAFMLLFLQWTKEQGYADHLVLTNVLGVATAAVLGLGIFMPVIPSSDFDRDYFADED